MGPQRPSRAELPRGGYETLEFFGAKDVRRGALTPTTEEVGRREFMPSIRCVHKAGKAEHAHQPGVPLRLGGGRRRPGDGRVCDDMLRTTLHGKAGKAAQIERHWGELQARRSSDSQRGRDRCQQHDDTSGQGQATCWSRW
jgi:hypothetical protein